MERKENDLMLNLVANPNFSIYDFKTVGLTGDNTSLQNKEFYKSNPYILKQFTDSESGKFNDKLFNLFYESALLSYNIMTNDAYNKENTDFITYHRNNIFAPVEKRRQGPEFKEVIVPNPDRVTEGLVRFGEIGERTKSRDELAQGEQVLLNPNEVYAGGEPNWDKAQWGKDPHNGFFDYSFDTLVMAQWDEEGDHIDPITGQLVHHMKGDLKVNPNGTYYYEKLDGRDIYGRRVLNKFNVLTEEGSFWNKYDFFDSDDIKLKSAGGTIMKNLALVGSMFIPYVGPVVVAASIATQLAGLMGTLGKMFTGSENNPIFSEMEGFAKSWNRQTAKTEYAQEHTWCLENWIGLVGDVAAQLKEQRFFFEKIPAIFKGRYAGSQKSYDKLLKEYEAAQKNISAAKLAKIEQLAGGKTAEYLKALLSLEATNSIRAQAELDSWIKGYNKIGEIFSKGYMTAITVGDTYGEAKAAGADDIDATLLTLGYAAGEYAILNTGIGEWILPELRADRYKHQAIAKALRGLQGEKKLLEASLKKLPSETKKEWFWKVFNYGKNIAKAEYANGTRTGKAILAGGLGEGVEEVSEELLADFSKGAYNTLNWLRGNDVRMDSFGFMWDDKGNREWSGKDLFDRYGMSFTGGIVGGALTNAGTTYRMGKAYAGMSSEQAALEMVYMIRNGNDELDKFYKTVSKMDNLGNKRLSATEFYEEDGQRFYKPGTKTDNQNEFAKQAIFQQVLQLSDLLHAEGVAMTDSKFLDLLILSDLRFANLSNAVTAGIFMQEYNSEVTLLASEISELNDLNKSQIDTNNNDKIDDNEKHNKPVKTNRIKELEKSINDRRKRLKDMVEGKNAYEFVRTTLFELSPLSLYYLPTTFPLYYERMTGKKYSEATENEKAIIMESYKQWKELNAKDQIKIAADIHFRMAQASSELINKYGNDYKKQSEHVRNLHYLMQRFSPNLAEELTELEQNKLAATAIRKKAIHRGFLAFFDSETLGLLWDEFETQTKALESELDPIKRNSEEYRILQEFNEKIYKLTELHFNNIVNPFLEWGYINTESKNELNNFIDSYTEFLEELAVDKNANDGLDEDEPNLYYDKKREVNSIKLKINNLPNTPLEKFVNEFAINLGNETVNLTEILHKANVELNKVSENASEFSLTDDVFNAINTAIATLLMFLAAIDGAKVDNGGYFNIYGYNITLNEIAKKSGKDLELAEITTDFANILLNDSEVNLKRLYFIRDLYKINKGQKLNGHQKTGTIKEVLFYKKMKSIVQVPDNDELKQWKNFDLLEAGLLELTLLSDLESNSDKSYTLNDVLKKLLELEKIKMRDLVHEFFKSNMDKLNDPAKLVALIDKFDIYTESEVLLNENLNEVDGPSMIWELAACAGIKASDFYSQYAKILDPNDKIVSVPSQEMCIFQNVAFVLQRDIFSKFYDAIRYKVKLDWKSDSPKQLSQEDKKVILKRLGYDDANVNTLSDPKYTDYYLTFLPIPRFKNISLIEGIAGSGKTSAVIRGIVKFLKSTYPDILKNAYIVHSAHNEENKSATKLQESVDLKGLGKALGKDAFTEEIFTKRIKFKYNSDGTCQVDASSWIMTDENEIKGSIETSNNANNAPSIIFIDEISHFNMLELDAINDYAEKHGIVVITAGDFDQLGVIGNTNINMAGKNTPMDLALFRNYFVRTMKLGISMRTDNAVLTTNLLKFQHFMNQPDLKLGLELTYVENEEEGLFGSKIFQKTRDFEKIKEEIDKLIEVLKKSNEGKSEEQKEKIQLIYTDANSDLYKYISDEDNGLKEYFNLSTSSSAQGQEGRFYVIDMSMLPVTINMTENTRRWLLEIYTGMTRATQGSIIVTTDSDIVKFNSIPGNGVIKEPLLQDAIKKLNNFKKSVYEEVKGKVPEYKEPIKSELQQNEKTTENNDDLNEGEDPQEIKDDEPEKLEIKDSNGQDIIEDIFIKYNDKYYIVDTINDDGTITISNSNESIENIPSSSVTISTVSYTSGEDINIGDAVTYNNEKYTISNIVDDNHVDITLESDPSNIKTVTIDSIIKGDNVINQEPLDKNGNKLIINDIVLYNEDGYKIIEIYPNGSIRIKLLGSSVNKEYTVSSSDVKVYYPEYTSGERMRINDVVTYKELKAIVKDLVNIGNILIEFDNGTTQNVSDSELTKGYKNAPENVSIDLSSYDFKIGDKFNEYDSDGNLINTFTITNAIVKRNYKIIHIIDKDNITAAISLDGFVSGYGTIYVKQTPEPPKSSIDLNSLPFKEGQSYIHYSSTGKELYTITIDSINSDEVKYSLLNNTKIYTKSLESFIEFFEKNNFKEVISRGNTEIILDEYDESEDIIIDSVKKESDLKNEINEANTKSDYKGKKKLKAVDQGENKPIIIETYLYTFNTFEYGRTLDKNGNPVKDSHSDSRIDSINGLEKIFRESGRYREDLLEKLDTYTEVLGKLHSAFNNATDTEDLYKRIEKILGKDLKGSINISFAVKLSPVIGDNLRNGDEDYVRKSANYYGFSKNEQHLNYGYDSKSGNVIPHKIVGIISYTNPTTGKITKDILEIPLYTISSPFTIILQNADLFPDLAELITKEMERNTDIAEIAFRLLEITKSNLKYKHIDDLLTIFNFSESALIRHTPDHWFSLKNENLGSSFIQKAGDYALDFGINYDTRIDSENWIDLNYLAQDPRITITPVMKALGRVDINGKRERVAKKGHPFVLVSFDKTINTYDDIYEQYLKQLKPDYNGLSKVSLYYVLPPKASLEDLVRYIDATKVLKETMTLVGNQTTAYQVLKILMNDPDFYKFVKDNGYYPLLEQENQLMDYLKQAIEAESESKTKLNNFLHKTVSVGALDGKTTAGKISMALYFRRALTTIAYNKTNPNSIIGEIDLPVIDLMTDVLKQYGYDIFYYLKLDKRNIGPFVVVSDDSTGNELTWTIDGKSYKINGKIDTYRFKTGDKFLKVISNTAYKIKQYQKFRKDPVKGIDKEGGTKTYAKYLIDMFGPLYFGMWDNLSNFAVETEEDSKLKKVKEDYLNKVNYINEYLRLNGREEIKPLENLDSISDERVINISYNNILDELVNNGIIPIEAYEGNTLFLFEIGKNKLEININLEFTYENGNSSYGGSDNKLDINEILSASKYEINITEFFPNGETKEYRAEVDGNGIKLYDDSNISSNTVPLLSVTDENLSSYINSAKSILTKLENSRQRVPQLKTLFTKFTYNNIGEFFAKLKSMPASKNLENILSSLLSSEELTEMEAQIANELIQENKRKLEEPVTPTCPVPVKTYLLT